MSKTHSPRRYTYVPVRQLRRLRRNGWRVTQGAGTRAVRQFYGQKGATR